MARVPSRAVTAESDGVTRNRRRMKSSAALCDTRARVATVLMKALPVVLRTSLLPAYRLGSITEIAGQPRMSLSKS